MEELKRKGVAEVFTPGAPTSEIDFLREGSGQLIDVRHEAGRDRHGRSPRGTNALDVETLTELRDRLAFVRDVDARVVV